MKSYNWSIENIENIDCVQIHIDNCAKFMVPEATCIDDRMTFGEAFGCARIEVGLGGIFKWHNKVYTTYKANEWFELNVEDQKVFMPYTIDESNQSVLSHTYEDTLENTDIDFEPYDPAFDDGFDANSIQLLGTSPQIFNLDNLGLIDIDSNRIIMIDENSDLVYERAPLCILVDNHGNMEDHEMIDNISSCYDELLGNYTFDDDTDDTFSIDYSD